MSTVWVTNKGNEKTIGGWDGKKYEFLPRKPVEVPVALAQHYFGLGLLDKTEALIRLGWIKTANDLPGALAKLDMFEITDTRPQGYRETSPTVDRTPLPVPRQGEGKGTQAA
jgi:hypothetical protein